MKISTTQENLNEGLSLVSRVSSKNINLPILQNVLLKVDGKILRLSATNLELAVSCSVRGKVEDEGECTVPARLFADYISLLKTGQVDLELSGNTLKVKSGKTETKINGIPATEFPVIPRVSEGQVYHLSISALHHALGSVLFATAQTESRPELTGVFFSFHGPNGKNTLTVAATDSYRLGETVIPLEKESSGAPTTLIVPGRTLIELGRMIGGAHNLLEATETLTVTVSENQVQFELASAELQSRVIEGTYPDYRQIIPAQFRTDATLPRAEFAAAVKAASLFTKSGLYDVRLEFSPHAPLVIRAADAATGEHRAEVSGEVTGAENFVVVNYKYLLDGLGAISDDEVIFKMIDASNPCLLVPKEPTEKYQYIVMPIKQ